MELTKIHNDLNMTGFSNFTATELDLFFVLCTRVKDSKVKTIELTFSELKKLSDYTPETNTRFIKDLLNIKDKIFNVAFNIKDTPQQNLVGGFVLFPTFLIDKDKQIVYIGVNEQFEYLFNVLEGNFTMFELQEFVKLEGKYTKNIYRLLKQWRTIGKASIKIEDFKALVDMPKSYRMTHIDSKVIEPAIEEFKKNDIFKNIKVEKIKGGQGNRVQKLEFTFEPEHRMIQEKNEEILPEIPLFNWGSGDKTSP